MKNTQKQLTTIDKLKIEKMREFGFSLKEIGLTYNLSRQRIHQILNEKNDDGRTK